MSLRLKILISIQRRIEKLPAGTKPPAWMKLVIKTINLLTSVKHIYLDSVQWFRNIYIVFLTDKSEPKIFKGYGYRWFAVRYANKRSDISKVNKYCGGKRHYVLSYDKNALIVVNRGEMLNLRKKRFIRKDYNIVDSLENAFFITN